MYFLTIVLGSAKPRMQRCCPLGGGACFGGAFACGNASPGIKMAKSQQKKTPHKKTYVNYVIRLLPI